MAAFDEADLRTLSLARPVVTAEGLDGFIRYQETLLALASESLSVAHQAALSASGIPLRELPALRALCQAFAGKRWAAGRIADRLASLRASDPDGEEARRLKGEVARLRSLDYWSHRYGAEVAALLEAREAPLVRLHQALGQLRPPALPV